MTFQGKTMRRTRDEEEEDDEAPPARAALKRSPDCGHRVSKSATACPECGRSTPKFALWRVLLLLLVALLIRAYIGWR
jgi:hypothetical protein